MSGALERFRTRLGEICQERGLLDEPVSVTARELTPEEAIGNPDHDDYPIIIGRERMIQAELRGACGHAFTDRPGSFSGRLSDVLGMPLANNYRRAVLVAVANAVARHLGLAERTIHCRDGDPVECARSAVGFVRERFPSARRIFLVGLQPRLLEALASEFEVRVTDLDAGNVGKKKAGVTVEPAEAANACIAWCDLIFATGSILANGTVDAPAESGKPLAFYGVTCAAAAVLLNLPRFCPLGR